MEVHRAQADALEIEARAKRKLADEYDAAQERGEVAGRGKPVNVPDGNNKTTTADLGLSRKAIHEARAIRDAEVASPGIVKATVDVLRRYHPATRWEYVGSGFLTSPACSRGSGRARTPFDAKSPQAQKARQRPSQAVWWHRADFPK